MDIIDLLLLIYYVSINIFLFSLMGIDKYKAIKQKWRISEEQLLTLCFLGGFLGLGLGMKIFRHKIRKSKFHIVLAFSTIIHIFLIYKIIVNFI